MINFFYKPYLYYNLIIRHKIFKKRDTYSQYQEDLFIKEFFKNKNDGFYVDVGCYHPLKYSNTALLYNLGWKGINIDINQTSIDLFNIARPKDKNVFAGLSNKNEKTVAYFDHLLSPLNTLKKNFSDLSSKNISFRKHKKKEITTYTFEKLIEKFEIKFKTIDFLNVDAEAHDFEVLEGFNLKKFRPKLICVELFDENLKINEKKFTNVLKHYNYSIIKKIGPNGFFLKNN